MGNVILTGVLFVMLGAFLGGTFALPSKYGKGYSWEMLWGAFFLFATIIIPLGLTCIWPQQLFNTWHQATWLQLLPPVFFGMLWGLGSFVSGLAFASAGLSLAYAITMGMQTSFGSTIPLIFESTNTMSKTVICVVIAGILVCLLGVILTGYAGIRKDKKQGSIDKNVTGKSPQVKRGILLAVFGGLLAACLNYSFSFGQPVLDIAKVQFDGDASKATLAVWVLALVGGSISSLGYCIYLLIKNRRANATGTASLQKLFGLALIMALLHDGAIFFYGLGSDLLGKLGPTIGFAIFASGMMLVGNLNGFFTREWKGAGAGTKRLLFSGLGSIVAGILILAYSNSLRN